MRPIPAPRIGDCHGLLRAINERERVRLDEFVTDFSVDDLFPPGLENALGRTRQFVSYARAAGLLKEDRGTVELTEIGKRYVRAGDDEHAFDVSPAQAEWLRRQLREKHMTDSIYHGLAIGLSLLSSSPGARVSTLDFGRALGYLGRAGWDNENTLQIQGERHLTLLRDLDLVDGERQVTEIGTQAKAELTLPVHMSLVDIAAQQNPGGADAVREAGEAEWAAAQAGAAEPSAEEPAAGEPPSAEPSVAAAPAASAPASDTGEYTDVGPGAWAEVSAEEAAAAEAAPAAAAQPQAAEPPPPQPSAEAPPAAPAQPTPEAPPAAGPPVPPADIWDTAAPDDPTRAYKSVPPPSDAGAGEPPAAGPSDAATVISSHSPAAAPHEATPAETPGAPSAAAPPDAAPVAAPHEGTPAEAPGGPAAAAAPVAAPHERAPAEAAGGPAAGAPADVPSAAAPAAAPHEAAPAAPVAAPPAAQAAAPAAEAPAVAAPLARRADSFLDAADLRAAALERGLRMDVGVYANVAAALGSGRHVVLVGPPGAGKTALALAVAKAAVVAGKAEGAVLVTGARGGDALTQQVIEAARRGRWLVIDDLDAEALDQLAPLSTFLAHLPVTLPGEEGELAAASGWRIVATAAAMPSGSPPLVGRFASIGVPPHEAFERAIDEAAGGDAVAAAAVRRLLPLRDLAPLGAGPFLAAARHAADRRAAAPADEATLAREVHAAYLAPLLGELDGAGQARVQALLGS
jgi:hypothetical protein